MLESHSSSNTRKQIFQLALRLAVSALLVSYLLAGLDRGALRSAIANVELTGFLVALVVYVPPQLLCAVRWATISSAVGMRLGWPRFQRLYLEGVFFSLCLPSSIGGDVVNAVRLGSVCHSRILPAGTILADRLVGFLGVFVVGLTAIAARHYTGWLEAGGIGCAVFLLIFIGTLFSLKTVTRTTRRLGGNSRFARSLESLLPYDRHPLVLGIAILLGVLVQVFNVFTVMALGRAMGIEAPAEAYFIGVPMVTMLTVAPITISGIGLREGGLVWMLSHYGGAAEDGVALGLLWFAATVVVGAVGGVLYMAGTNSKAPEIALSGRAHDEATRTENLQPT